MQKTENKYPQFLSNSETSALIIYTSGTTGFPKGAMLSHEALFWNSINTSLRLNVTSKDSTVIFLPLFHTGGWNVLTTPCLHRWAKVILLKKFDADLVLDLCESEKVIVRFGGPTTVDFFNRCPVFIHRAFASVREPDTSICVCAA